MNKRKRIKLECEECGSQFDDDYKSRHEKSIHGGKKVKVKHVGAPLNPFEASKRKATVSVPADPSTSVSTMLATQSPTLSSTAEMSFDIFEGSTIVESSFITESSPLTVNKVTDESLVVKVNKKVDKETLVETETNEPTILEDESFSWISCAGQVTEFLANFERASDILTNIKTVAVPNPKMFIVEIIDCLSKMHKEYEELLQYARKGEKEMLEENEEAFVTENDFIDHDPGKRKKDVLSQQDRLYLISLGPFQPKITVFPENEAIPLNKQRRFNPTWYRDFPMLEYSIEKDAAFCFSCRLFPRSADTSEWASSGVRIWHKMKSRGTKKKGKLTEHFTSQSHQAAMSDYCHFLDKKSHVDVLLDKNLRDRKIKEEQQKDYYKKVLEILIDVAWTLARQGLAFRGHESGLENDNGNFCQMVNLVARHSPIMAKWLKDTDERQYGVTYLGVHSQNEFINLLGTEST